MDDYTHLHAVEQDLPVGEAVKLDWPNENSNKHGHSLSALLDCGENGLDIKFIGMDRASYQELADEETRSHDLFYTGPGSSRSLGSPTSIERPISQVVDGDEFAIEDRENYDAVFDDDDDAVCTICQDPYDSGAEISSIVLRLPCTHTFHADCIRSWLARSNTCPTCRFAPPVACGDARHVVVARRDSQGFYELERRDSIDLLIEHFARERAAAATAAAGCVGRLARSVSRYFAAGALGTAGSA
jgi:hypothetical protein